VTAETNAAAIERHALIVGVRPEKREIIPDALWQPATEIWHLA
jgi:hypothetical protein